MVLLLILTAMIFYRLWNLFWISLLETICLTEIIILLIELKTVCAHLPSILSICITKKIFKNKKKLQLIRELCKDNVILKPHKGSGVVVIDTTDYYESLNKLISDEAKFKRLDTDPNNIRLCTLQSFLQKLYNRIEISEEVYQEFRP